MNGGTLPLVTGVNFTNITAANVTDANLAAYDTALLNVASSTASGGLGCNMANLPAAGKTALVNFVNAGKKLIIYDSECAPQDYSWLPYSFTTSNPGAMGAHGTLTIVENNSLASNIPGDPKYIDATRLSNNTDAVGDMNVMTTYNPNWCVSMAGTNILNVTGPVHTYAKLVSGANEGLIIYNGLDTDYMSSSVDLQNIWKFEVLQPFNPSGLPCGRTVVGITLKPDTATNVVGTQHTVTATLKALPDIPQPGILVSFAVIGGPNTGVSGVCNPADCKTDTNGQVTWTYTGTNIAGTDQIRASFVDAAGTTIYSQTVTKVWTVPQNTVAVDVKPLFCPNPVLAREGVIPIAVVGTLAFNVSKIDVPTVRVETDLVPIVTYVKDVATPYAGTQTVPTDCNKIGADGVMDLVLFINNTQLFAKFGPVVPGNVLTVHVTGKLKPAYGGAAFNGSDIVVVQ
ncbi:MAG: hypothetical protein ACE15B_14130 [Bryobacteraceae bacterium]